jgi:N-methylhydantoinase A/oxoprolinase/acetone carboxylase beta subunit
VPFEDIILVSLSTTLATNSVVEGKGCRVGMIVAGDDYRDNILLEHKVRIKGGHTIRGKPIEDLDLDAAREFVRRIKHNVDAIGVSTFFSVINPEHEIMLREMIREESDLPVVTGHELSLQLGFHERNTTVVLNAKLIPLITDLISSVRKVLND